MPGSRHSFPPLWLESLWLLDWLTLRLSRVYRGVGVPRGDGSPVVLVPGFLGTDIYLSEMFFWLHRIGYRPYMSAIGINAHCPERLMRRLLSTMERAHADTGRPVRLIGHSLGGVIGRSACIERPELASQLIFLGSPVHGIHTHPAMRASVALVRTVARAQAREGNGDCLTDRCGCAFGRTSKRPLPARISHAAIYTRGDAVVDWHDALERDPRLNHEVGGTHVGLVFNPRAYRVLAGLLADSGLAKDRSKPE